VIRRFPESAVFFELLDSCFGGNVVSQCFAAVNAVSEVIVGEEVVSVVGEAYYIVEV
jgi:hypothetical protein